MLLDEEGPGVMLETESKVAGSIAAPTSLPAPAPHHMPSLTVRWQAFIGRAKSSGPSMLGHDAPAPRPMGYLQRSGSKGTWSRTSAKATRFARWPKAQAMTPEALPRAASSWA